jgi:glutathione synthase/RimK-type ligase-like ATP-grasp enzyme
MSVDVLLATAVVMTKPDPESHLLRDALFAQGIRSEMAGWDDPNVDWASAELVLIRTPWNYVAHHAAFLAWAQRTAKAVAMQNSIQIIEWNIHKSYLLELQAKGVPVMPTLLLPKGTTAPDLSDAGEHELVVKPAIDGGGRGAMRSTINDPALIRHVIDIAKERDVLVQPYAPEIAKQGEVSLIYFGGEYSHAVRKIPKSGDYRVQSRWGGTVVEHTPTAAEFATAEKALSAAPGKVTYARVDMVDYQGTPTLMELELIEPELFLGYDKQSAPRLAQAIARHL